MPWPARSTLRTGDRVDKRPPGGAGHHPPRGAVATVRSRALREVSQEAVARGRRPYRSPCPQRPRHRPQEDVMANDRAVAPRPSRSADDLEKDPRAPRYSQARSGTLQTGHLRPGRPALHRARGRCPRRRPPLRSGPRRPRLPGPAGACGRGCAAWSAGWRSGAPVPTAPTAPGDARPRRLPAPTARWCSPSCRTPPRSSPRRLPPPRRYPRSGSPGRLPAPASRWSPR